MNFLRGLNWVCIISILVAVEQQIASGTVSLANSFPASWIPAIKEWAGNLAMVGALIISYKTFGAGKVAVVPHETDTSVSPASVKFGGGNAAIATFFLASAALLCAIASPVLAADVATKAPKSNPLFKAYPYQTSGFFFGIYTEGGGGSVNGSVPGVGSASLTTNSAGVGGTVGYAWGRPDSNVAYSVEADFGWTNFNGSTQGFSLSGPASFEQRFVAFTPLSSVINLLPNFPGLGTVPPFPGLPSGVTASNLQLGLMGGIDENDISPNFPGLAQNREWRIAPMIGLVAMEQLSNGVALRTWIKTIFPDKSVCVGPIGAAACAGLGQQVKVGVGLYF